MTRVVSVGRSFNGLWAAGALGLALLTISLSGAGCAGSLDPAFAGAAGSNGGAGPGAAGTGAAGTTGMAGTTGGGTPGCDVTPLVNKYTCAQAGACHDANGAGANFNMAAADWTTHLVNVVPKGGGALPSICAKDPAFMNVPYIKKSDPNGDGIFMQKLQGAICSPMGVQMPFGMAAASAADINCFKQFATALANQ